MEVFVCSNPKCAAVHAQNPMGHCPVCVTAGGVGFSTMPRTVQPGKIATIANSLALRQVDILESALRKVMLAYERRIRSDCRNAEEIARQPWRCEEYVAGERALAAVAEPTAGAA